MSTLMTAVLSPTQGTRRKGNVAKTRGVDPATSERPYAEEEAAFLKAVDDYRNTNNRPFVTPSECLAIAKNLGYMRWGVSA